MKHFGNYMNYDKIEKNLDRKWHNVQLHLSTVARKKTVKAVEFKLTLV